MASADAGTMRAIRVHTPGGPEALVVEDLPTPVPAPGEVRVRAEVIGVGRPDVLIRQGTYKWMPPLPAVPGAELVGIVEALGDGAPRELLGQRVLVSARELPQRGGCYAEAICVPASAPFVLPERIAPADAASLPNVQLALALMQCAGGAPVGSVLIPGAAGGVGSALTQVARAKGARVFGTARGEAKRRFALDNGAEAIVAADPAALADDVRALTGGRGVDMAFDHLGGEWLTAGLHALAPMGMLVSYNLVLGFPQRETLKEMRALLGRSLALRTFSMHTYDELPAQRRALLEEAIALMAAGRVKAPPTLSLPMAQVRQAHELLDRGDVLGKLVLVP
ncbi:zinc-dependent alcohol dehydrogenase family protein [Ideonella aquatica]|nr:zinc-dependent alcohol dehydrogenase family protein [Ideonella aquatica]